MSEIIEVLVAGIPAPQGSKKFVGMRGGHAVMVESSKAVKPWRKAVKKAAELAMVGRTALDGPLVARVILTVKKPASAPKRSRTWPATSPDLSKLLRSTEDALTDAGLWADDGRVVEYSRLAKVFAGEDAESLPYLGVRIVVMTMGYYVSRFGLPGDPLAMAKANGFVQGNQVGIAAEPA